LNRLCNDLSFRTFEVYPTATRKILFPDLTEKKQLKAGRKKLMDKLAGCGVSFPCQSQIYTHDEMDAALAAFTVLLHDNGSSIALGNHLDGFIVLPDFKSKSG
jgi:predicted nuclease with RNAse H fold